MDVPIHIHYIHKEAIVSTSDHYNTTVNIFIVNVQNIFQHC